MLFICVAMYSMHAERAPTQVDKEWTRCNNKAHGIKQSFVNPACSGNMSEIDRVLILPLMHRLSISQRASGELSTRHQSSW